MIRFNDIHLSYDGKKVIEGLSFEVKQGEKVVLSGKSGSGKSSLFALALGFVDPDEGEIVFEEVRVDEKSAWDVRRKTAYIDQDVSLGNGRVLDIFDFVSGLKANLHLGRIDGKARELFRYFELDEDIFNKNIEDLSGGERQRLAIVISALLERNVFFLDEVTSALDKHLKKKVVDYFTNREDWTFLVISHEPQWLENPSIKVFDLEGGKWKL